jgi:hypothetical protein
VKTKEQVVREYQHLKKIEKIRAKERERVRKGKQPGASSENLSDLSKGKAADIAAAQVGMSAPTAEKASVVVDEIDKREEAGEPGPGLPARVRVKRS